MAIKNGAKSIQVDGDIVVNFRRAIELEGWSWGLTKKVESLLKDYAINVFQKHNDKWIKLVSDEIVVDARPKSREKTRVEEISKVHKRRRAA